MSYVYDHDRRAISAQRNETVKEHVRCNRRRGGLYQESHYYFKWEWRRSNYSF